MSKKKKKKTGKKNRRQAPILTRSQLTIRHIKNHLGIYLSLLSLAIAIPGLLYYFHDKKLASLAGEISADGLAQIKYIAVGSSVRLKIDTPQGVLFKDGDQPLISVSLENGKLSISTIIRDSRGEIIAELVNNEWQVNRNNIFDRNYNDNAIEVRDRGGKVALQVAHFGDTIYFAGIFTCKNGRTVSLHPIQKGGAAMELIPPGKESDYLIDPIFNYPSDRHFGICPGLKALKNKLLHSKFTEYKFITSLDICKADGNS